MKKRVCIVVLAILLLGSLTSVIRFARAQPRTWTVDDDGPADFHTIQEAINATSPGDTVRVSTGTYYEAVDIDKNVSLIGEDVSNTVIDGNGDGSVIYIHHADGGTVSGFTVEDGFDGISIYASNNISVVNNIVVGCDEDGIESSYSTRITLSGNTMSNNRYGIKIYGGSPPIAEYFDHSIDSANMINGKPMIYVFNKTDMTLDSVEMGGLILAFCYNVSIANSTIGYFDYLETTSSTDVLFSNNTLGTLYTHFSKRIVLVNNIASNHFFSNNAFGLYIGIGSENVVLLNNNISNNNHDNVMIDGARKVTLRNNLVSGYANSWAGVCIYDSEEVDLVGNIITNNTSTGVALVRTSNINLYGNTISYNKGGIRAFSCRDGNMTENMIMMNVNCGVGLESSSHLDIFHNSFNNTNQVSILDASNNSWDNGYPSGGNYWSNYNGTDLDQDGIGDAPYGIDANNTDNYPLMGMFSDFIATSEYRVQTICNSTITDFQFNGTTIRLNTSGQNGTFGFFRICIPKALMNDIYMFVDGGEVIPILLPCSDSNNSYLYFNYKLSTLNTLKDRADLNEDGIVNVLDMCILSVAWNSTQADPQWVAEADLNGDGVIDDLDMNLLVSVIGENTSIATHEVTIIPELSLLILAMFMTATLLAVIICKRKRSSNLSKWQQTQNTELPSHAPRFSKFYFLNKKKC